MASRGHFRKSDICCTQVCMHACSGQWYLCPARVKHVQTHACRLLCNTSENIKSLFNSWHHDTVSAGRIPHGAARFAFWVPLSGLKWDYLVYFTILKMLNHIASSWLIGQMVQHALKIEEYIEDETILSHVFRSCDVSICRPSKRDLCSGTWSVHC